MSSTSDCKQLLNKLSFNSQKLSFNYPVLSPESSSTSSSKSSSNSSEGMGSAFRVVTPKHRNEMGGKHHFLTFIFFLKSKFSNFIENFAIILCIKNIFIKSM
jgi:hypothetical protein